MAACRERPYLRGARCGSVSHWSGTEPGFGHERVRADPDAGPSKFGHNASLPDRAHPEASLPLTRRMLFRTGALVALTPVLGRLPLLARPAHAQGAEPA